jgi:hypothetical protein
MMCADRTPMVRRNLSVRDGERQLGASRADADVAA